MSRNNKPSFFQSQLLPVSWDTVHDGILKKYDLFQCYSRARDGRSAWLWPFACRCRSFPSTIPLVWSSIPLPLHVTGITEQLRERSRFSCSRWCLPCLRRRRLSCALAANAYTLIPGLIVTNILQDSRESLSKAVNDSLNIVIRKIHPLVSFCGC